VENPVSNIAGAAMAISSLIKLVRRYFQDTTAAAKEAHVKRPRGRRPMLVQLEERRVFNATFALDTGGLALNHFDTSSNLTVRDNGNALLFELDGAASNTWTGSVGAGVSLLSSNTILSIDKTVFSTNASISIVDDQGAGLDVTINDSVTLPAATVSSNFSINIGGQLDIAKDTGGSPSDTLDASGYTLQ